MKRTPLRGGGFLRRTRKPRRASARADARVVPMEPGKVEYKEIRRGQCQVCNHMGLIQRHHVVLEQHVRRMGGDPWDQRNAIWVGAYDTCQCHRHHHDAFARIPYGRISLLALEFAAELFGDGETAAYYFRRFYADGPR